MAFHRITNQTSPTAYMALAIDAIDGRGLNNEPHCELPFNQLYVTNKTEHFGYKSGHAVQVVKLI